MNEDLSEFKDLIKMIEEAPKAKAPDRFTEGVMMRLAAEENVTAWARIKQAVRDLVTMGNYPKWTEYLTIRNARECSYCFFMTGFFYLIMGIVLMAGFRTIDLSMTLTGWIALQPYLTLGTAVWLFMLGSILLMDGETSVKISLYGSMGYIFFNVFNGILIRPYLHIPYAGVFVTGFIAAGILMGTMLALAVRKTELMSIGWNQRAL